MSVKLLSSTAISKDEIGEQEQPTISYTRSKRTAENRLSQIIPRVAPNNRNNNNLNDSDEENVITFYKLIVWMIN